MFNIKYWNDKMHNFTQIKLFGKKQRINITQKNEIALQKK